MKVSITKNPRPEALEKIVKKAMRRTGFFRKVVSRQALISKIRRFCTISEVLEEDFHWSRKKQCFTNEIVFNHMVDVALSNLKKSEYFYSAGRGLYTYRKGLAA